MSRIIRFRFLLLDEVLGLDAIERLSDAMARFLQQRAQTIVQFAIVIDQQNQFLIARRADVERRVLGAEQHGAGIVGRPHRDEQSVSAAGAVARLADEFDGCLDAGLGRRGSV